MSLSRLQLRRLVGQDTAGLRYVLGTVSGTPDPTFTTFTLPELTDTGADAGTMAGHWVYHVDSGEERRITKYRPDTGEVVLNRGLTDAPTAGDDIEVHRFRPSLIHRAINDGLQKCVQIALFRTALTENQRAIDLSAQTHITQATDVIAVYIGPDDDDATDALPPREVTFARRYSNGLLYLDPMPVLAADEMLWVESYAPFAALAADTDTTDCPELWIRAAARAALYNLLIAQSGAGKEMARYQAERTQAQREQRHYARVYGARQPRKIAHGTPVRWSVPYLSSRSHRGI
ncbi:MAG: hypothetical protein AB7Q01_08420 [Gammaproteobacteria bacterium]